MTTPPWDDPALTLALREHTRLGILLLDAELRILALNRWFRIRLPTKPTPIGRPLLEVFPRLDPRVLAALHEALQTRHPRVLTPAFTPTIFPLLTAHKAPMRQVVYLVPLAEHPGLAVLVEDITERVRYEEALNREVAQRTASLRRRETFLQGVNLMLQQALQLAGDPDALTKQLTTTAQHLFEASDAALCQHITTSQEAVLVAFGSLGEALRAHLPINASTTWTQEALRRNKPLWVPNAQTSIYLPKEVAQHLPPRAVLVLPLSPQHAPPGSLILGFSADYPLRPEWLTFGQLVSDALTLAFDHAALYQQVRDRAQHLENLVQIRTAALQEANAELEAFVFSVSHDLRAPLRAINGFALALQEDFGALLPAEGQEYLERIFHAAERMDRLLNDLLAYSRVSRHAPKVRPLPLEPIVQRVLDDLQEAILQAQAHIEVQRPLPLVFADESLLYQILLNLVSNAIKFVPPGRSPRVVIQAEVTDESPGIRIWVQDNGIGIPPEHRERIFGVFERLHGEEAYPGTGIGLAIVRKAAQRLGGQVGVESTVGEGSRFWVWLPTP